MKEALYILEKIMEKFWLINRLKQGFLGICISARTSHLIELEIYEKVNELASRKWVAKA